MDKFTQGDIVAHKSNPSILYVVHRIIPYYKYPWSRTVSVMLHHCRRVDDKGRRIDTTFLEHELEKHLS